MYQRCNAASKRALYWRGQHDAASLAGIPQKLVPAPSGSVAALFAGAGGRACVGRESCDSRVARHAHTATSCSRAKASVLGARGLQLRTRQVVCTRGGAEEQEEPRALQVPNGRRGSSWSWVSRLRRSPIEPSTQSQQRHSSVMSTGVAPCTGAATRRPASQAVSGCWSAGPRWASLAGRLACTKASLPRGVPSTTRPWRSAG